MSSVARPGHQRDDRGDPDETNHAKQRGADHATNKAAITRKVARQADLDHSELTMAAIRLEAVRSPEVMTSTYEDFPRISIGRSCGLSREIPTKTRLHTPTTQA